MGFSLIHFFTSLLSAFQDPIMKTSLLGTLGMALSSSIMGVLLFVRKRSLMGETLSHAAFPGILIGSLIPLLLGLDPASWNFYAMTAGGVIFALLGLKCVNWMETQQKVKPDAALTWTLASWMGWGVLLASLLQQTHPTQYRLSLLYLYGQVVTMTTSQAFIYAGFALLVIGFVITTYPYLKWFYFDPVHAQMAGFHCQTLETVTFILIVITIILGIRSSGVILMVGMLIGPAVAARRWTKRFSTMMIASTFFGMLSAMIGSALSVHLSSPAFSVPTGPVILLTTSCCCFLSLLFAPSEGFLIRLIRMQQFKLRCQMENSLKQLWKNPGLPLQLPFYLKLLLKVKQFVSSEGKLTALGTLEAEKIVRLHRLWEVYLVEYLGQHTEEVHQTAEELEHLFSPSLEQKLSSLLNNPQKDPHHQPIPPRKDLL
ncbi:MAG: iron chelate uptake ABC transporter family permease subunit [Candidatus Rhabdochlamydia sp.]